MTEPSGLPPMLSIGSSHRGGTSRIGIGGRSVPLIDAVIVGVSTLITMSVMASIGVEAPAAGIVVGAIVGFAALGVTKWTPSGLTPPQWVAAQIQAHRGRSGDVTVDGAPGHLVFVTDPDPIPDDAGVVILETTTDRVVAVPGRALPTIRLVDISAPFGRTGVHVGIIDDGPPLDWATNTGAPSR